MADQPSDFYDSMDYAFRAQTWLNIIEALPAFNKALMQNSFMVTYLGSETLERLKKAQSDPEIHNIIIAIDSPGSQI